MSTIVYLIIGCAALIFGVATSYLRARHPHKLKKLAAMQGRFGETRGRAIHQVAYSVLPIVLGTVLLTTGAGIRLPGLGSRAELNRIVTVFESGDLETSGQLLEDFLTEHPDDETALILQGHVHYDGGRIDAAEQSYQRALTASDGKSFRAHNALAILYEESRNDLARAEQHYKTCIKLNPKYAQAYSGLAILKLRQFKDAEALDFAEKAHALHKKDPVIASNLAIAYHFNHRTDERDAMAQRAADLGYQSIDSLKKIFAGELSIR